MTDLDDRFNQVRELPVPELRSDVDRRLAGPLDLSSEGGTNNPSARQRLLAGTIAGLVFVTAGGLFWLTTRDAPATPSIPAASDGSEVLLVRCDSQSIEVLTPVVVAQPDGIHVKASVTELSDPEVSLHSTGEPNLTVLSGSSGVDSEFVRELPPGDVTVRCESGPWQMDGPEKLDASFSLIDPNSAFTEYQPSCPNVKTLGPQSPDAEQFGSESERLSPVDVVRAEVTGLEPTDAIEQAGYAESTSNRAIVRVMRADAIVGAFFVSSAGPRSFIDDGRVCPDSGLAYQDGS